MSKCRDITYASCMEYVMRFGIWAKTPTPHFSAGKRLNNINTRVIQVPISNIEYTKQPINNEFLEADFSFQAGKYKKKRSDVVNEEESDARSSDEYSNRRFYEIDGLYGRGLLYYRKWWEKGIVDVFINGGSITGTPLFISKNTLRLVNDSYSYFIPLEKIDYIRTADGLKFS